jgi:hypothetical protein
MDDLLRLLKVLAPSCRTCVVFGVWGLASALGLWGRATLMLVAVAFGGCATSPSHVDRPTSNVRGNVATTALGHIDAGASGRSVRISPSA